MPRSIRPRRRGSALVIVLGVLAVMMLMAVAFSTFVRTERGGSTNLKNSLVARSSLLTALGRAMEAIDMSFGSATNDDPVALWPHPWLASGPITNDYFQSAALGDGETASAHVLTAEIAEYLTPAQLALARSARCEWAPIYSSISASAAFSDTMSDDPATVYGNYGRPSLDSIVGRYAFVALDTTGLLDMNNDGGGTAAKRKATAGGDPLALMIPDGDAKDANGNSVKRFVKDPDSFVSKRNSSKLFYSMADAKTLCGKSVLAIDPSDRPNSSGGYYPADLFAGFAPSLAPLDPEGNPKVKLPLRSELGSLSSDDWLALVPRVFRAMIGIFARGRVANGRQATSYAEDQFPIFENTGGKKYQLSRSALATVALLDGLDSDFIPGQSTSPTCNYWLSLRPMTNWVQNADGKTKMVTESGPSFHESSQARNALNYPCTESAPLVNGVYAWIEIDRSSANDTKSDPDDTSTWKRTYKKCTLHVGARAICQNRTSKSNPHKATVSLEWEVMSGTPADLTVTGGDDTGIRTEMIEWTGGSGGFLDDSGGSKIVWKNFFTSGSCSSSEETVNDNASTGDRIILASDEHPFTIECLWNDDADDWYPPTRAEYLEKEEGEDVSDVFIPIRMKVTVSGDGGDIQQVPAPAISKDNKDYWLRVDPAVYHGGKSQFGGDCDGSFGELAWGWAFCAVPAFGFDTSSLVTDGEDKPVGSTMGFWVNNIIALKGGDGGGFLGGDVGGGRFDSLVDYFFRNSEANENASAECAGGGFLDPNWNYLQLGWLFSIDVDDDDEPDYSNVFEWMNTSSGCHVPDMLHCFKKGGAPFVQNGKVNSSSRLEADLFSRIPADGYANAADLGTVMCGPYETLSLFKTWRWGDTRADFHPILDYFTMESDRYPALKDITGAGVTADGGVNWKALSGSGTASDPFKDLYSAVHNGRANLNAPFLVEASGDTASRGKASKQLNPYPIAAVFNGCPYPASQGEHAVTNSVSADKALVLAADFCRMLKDSQLGETKATSPVFGKTRNVVRNLSFLGAGNADGNDLLEHFVQLAEPRCDSERESLLRGTIDGFTTRGQTYLVIIRADAYSPKFGESSTVEGGTTLATTHAVVELFRDPVPARAPDGCRPTDGTNPVAYHNWYIRSFRVF